MSVFRINKKEKVLFSQAVFCLRVEAIKNLMLNISFFKKWISTGICIVHLELVLSSVLYWNQISL